MDYLGGGKAKGMLAPAKIIGGSPRPPSSYAYERDTTSMTSDDVARPKMRPTLRGKNLLLISKFFQLIHLIVGDER